MKVERTFVFVDLSGFTKYTAANGDLSAGEILTRFRAKVRDVAAQCGVLREAGEVHENERALDFHVGIRLPVGLDGRPSSYED